MKTYREFKLGNVKLLSGKILNYAKLIYKTYGKLNKDRSNVIVLPTFYTGTHIRNEGFIGRNRALNPNKYFIVSIIWCMMCISIKSEKSKIYSRKEINR